MKKIRVGQLWLGEMQNCNLVFKFEIIASLSVGPPRYVAIKHGVVLGTCRGLVVFDKYGWEVIGNEEYDRYYLTTKSRAKYKMLKKEIV